VGELKKNPTPGFARFQWANGGGREIHVERETMNTLVLKLGAGPEAELIRTDTFFPGWTATVDGKEFPAEHADPFFSKIKIPAGAQTLTLHYTPTLLHRGIILAGISLLLTVAISWRLWRAAGLQALPA